MRLVHPRQSVARALAVVITIVFLRAAAISQADEPEKPIIVSGRVTDEQKRPIAGAEVGLMLIDNLNSQAEENRPFAATTRSDADGKFSIPVDRQLARRWSTMWAHAKGYGPARHQFTNFVENWPRNTDLTIALDAAAETTIRVVDSSEMSVFDADVTVVRVRIKDSIGWLVPEDWADRFHGRTNRDGLVTFPSLVPGSLECLRVETIAAGRVEWDLQWFLNNRPAKQSPHLTISMPDAGRVVGILKASDADAPSKVSVMLTTRVERDHNLPIGVRGVATVTTDASGRFVAPRLAAGALGVEFDLPKGGQWQPQLPAHLRVEAGNTTEFEAPLARGVKIRGLIRKQDTGEGYPKFQLWVIYGPSVERHQDMKDHVELETDKDGYFTTYVPPGAIELRLNSLFEDYHHIEWWDGRSRGGVWGSRRMVPSDVAEFDVEPIDLVPAVRIKGKLVDNQGKPLHDWMVIGYPEAKLDANGVPDLNRTMNSFAGVHTNAKGEFEGNVPSTHPPIHWKVVVREQNTYEIKDNQFLPTVISENPLVLQVEEDLPKKKKKGK